MQNLVLYGNSWRFLWISLDIFNQIYSNIDGITGFSEEDSQSVLKFMQSAVEMATSDGMVNVQIFCLFHSICAQEIMFSHLWQSWLSVAFLLWLFFT